MESPPAAQTQTTAHAFRMTFVVQGNKFLQINLESFLEGLWKALARLKSLIFAFFVRNAFEVKSGRQFRSAKKPTNVQRRRGCTFLVPARQNVGGPGERPERGFQIWAWICST